MRRWKSGPDLKKTFIVDILILGVVPSLSVSLLPVSIPASLCLARRRNAVCNLYHHRGVVFA